MQIEIKFADDICAGATNVQLCFLMSSASFSFILRFIVIEKRAKGMGSVENFELD